jgi:hypothetical protein
MRRISSGWTFFYKRVFPIVWCGFIVLFFGTSLYHVSWSDGAVLPFLIVPFLMLGFGFYFMKKFVFDLVDEVWEDGGDALLVKNRDQQQRIDLADIKNVNYTALSNPPRVTLSLRRPTIFGEQITFCAPVRLVPFATSPLINELIERVDAARERRR